jgi:thiamine-phosphate pyrophosphorylase
MICLVTDRRRREILAQVEDAVAARIDLVQIREPDLDAASLAAIVAHAVALTRGTATRIIVNDRLDIALASGADGVHLRASSFSAAAARRISPPRFLVGRSVHSAADAATAGEVDYLVAGTLFPTSSKPDVTPLLGLDGLHAVVAAASAPVLAIGGVTVDRLDAIAATGAAGVAAIGLFADSGSVGPNADAIRNRFDTMRSRPYHRPGLTLNGG